LAAANAATKKYPTPDGATLLLVGAKIEAGVGKLNLGESVVAGKIDDPHGFSHNLLKALHRD